MKKILLILLIFVFSLGNTVAYSPEDFLNSKVKYKALIEKKIGKKIDRLDAKTTQILIYRIEKEMNKYSRSTKLSDAQKLKQISLLHALLEVILEKNVV